MNKRSNRRILLSKSKTQTEKMMMTRRQNFLGSSSLRSSFSKTRLRAFAPAEADRSIKYHTVQYLVRTAGLPTPPLVGTPVPVRTVRTCAAVPVR